MGHAELIDYTVLLLPMIQVRNQIRDMFGGETGKITFGRIKCKFRALNNKNSALCTIYWYIGKVQTVRLLVKSL